MRLKGLPEDTELLCRLFHNQEAQGRTDQMMQRNAEKNRRRNSFFVLVCFFGSEEWAASRHYFAAPLSLALGIHEIPFLWDGEAKGLCLKTLWGVKISVFPEPV